MGFVDCSQLYVKNFMENNNFFSNTFSPVTVTPVNYSNIFMPGGFVPTYTTYPQVNTSLFNSNYIAYPQVDASIYNSNIFYQPQQLYSGVSYQNPFNLNLSTNYNTTTPATSTNTTFTTSKNTSTTTSNFASSTQSVKSFANYATTGSILSSDKQRYGVSEKRMPDGTNVYACRWTRFNNCRPEWLAQQKYLLQAAKEFGFTILYSDVERTVAESDAGRAKKGKLVCKGGESPHNYGVAADIVCYKNGKPVSVDSAEYKAFAQRAVQLSNNKIEWGGEWTKKGEKHHFNIRNWRSAYKKREYLVG